MKYMSSSASADADVVQVLNLFLALLLSSFGAQSLQSSNNGNNEVGGGGGGVGGGGDEAPNKLIEAIERIRRWSAFVKSRCCPLSPSRRTSVSADERPLHDDASPHSLPDAGQPRALPHFPATSIDSAHGEEWRSICNAALIASDGQIPIASGI